MTNSTNREKNIMQPGKKNQIPPCDDTTSYPVILGVGVGYDAYATSMFDARSCVRSDKMEESRARIVSSE